MEPQLLFDTFLTNGDPLRADQMSAYMKNKFAFYGISAAHRKALQSPFLKAWKQLSVEDVKIIVSTLWSHAQREVQYTAIDLLRLHIKKWHCSDVEYVIQLIQDKSWWDTVDILSIRCIGPLMHRCNDYVPTKPKSWITSDDMWIRRCAIIYQLGYKRNTDQSLLFSLIDDTKDERTFFINKAQGWALREYAKVEPEAVLHYINTTSGLAPLAVREATRIMAKNIQ